MQIVQAQDAQSVDRCHERRERKSPVGPGSGKTRPAATHAGTVFTSHCIGMLYTHERWHRAAPNGPLPHLRVELDVRRAEADEAREERLVQVRVLLEGHVLHHGRQLVVVANQDDALESAVVPAALGVRGPRGRSVHGFGAMGHG